MQAMVGARHDEELRDHLLQRFESVYSGYGATDIEIGMAGESPASGRNTATRADPARIAPRTVWRRFAPADGVSVQPLIHYLEVNAEREVICTISRLDVLAHGSDYNVHDEGGSSTTVA